MARGFILSCIFSLFENTRTTQIYFQSFFQRQIDSKPCLERHTTALCDENKSAVQYALQSNLFMQDATLKILTATLKSDATISPIQRGLILKLARDGAPSEPVAGKNKISQPAQRIYSREEVAKLLGSKTPRYVDKLCKRGLLQKFTPKGNRRAIGILCESLQAFLAGSTI
jgi:hypothetical protein